MRFNFPPGKLDIFARLVLAFVRKISPLTLIIPFFSSSTLRRGSKVSPISQTPPLPVLPTDDLRSSVPPIVPSPSLDCRNRRGEFGPRSQSPIFCLRPDNMREVTESNWRPGKGVTRHIYQTGPAVGLDSPMTESVGNVMIELCD